MRGDTPSALGRLLRWLKRIGIGFAALLALFVVIGAIYETRERRRAAREHPAPGALVDIGGRRMHLDCRGTGTPTVIFEAGLDGSGSLAWTTVHDSVARTTRACAYDRAGIMWSDGKRDAQHAVAVADDLHAMLTAAGEAGPFVLVGHSLGGPYITTYTSRHGADVAGLVFVDASHPDQDTRLAEVLPEPPAVVMAVYQLVGALAWTGAARVAIERMGGLGAGPPGHEDEARAYSGTSFNGVLSESNGIKETWSAASSARGSLGDRPTIVLSGLKPLSAEDLTSMKMSSEDGSRMQAIWRELQEDMATWSTQGRIERLDDAGHYVQYDRPDRVIAAVREVVAMVRAGGAQAAQLPPR